MRIYNNDFRNKISSAFPAETQQIKPQKNFKEFLLESLGSVNTIHKNSERAAELFAAGQIDNIHDVMIAAEKAEIALQLTLQVRNKIMEAYQEIMRMQI